MLRYIWRRSVGQCRDHRCMTSSALQQVPKYFPFEGLGLKAEDYMVLYNRHEEVLGHDPLGFFTDRKTLLKVKRNMRILEEIGMSIEQRKAMLLGTWRILEVTPSVLTDQIEFYRKRLRLDGAELRQYFLTNPDVLNESIENHISPRIGVYKALGIKRAQLRRMVLLFPELLTLKLDDNLVPAMRALAKCNFTLAQGMSVLRNFPHVVGMPHDMIKTTIRLLQAHGIDNKEILTVYKKAGRVRLDNTGKYGEEVRWFVTRLTGGTKLGVLVLKEGIACGFRFGKKDMRELLEPKGFDWEPIWEAIEARRKARHQRSQKQLINPIQEANRTSRLADQLVRLATCDIKTSHGGGIAEESNQVIGNAGRTHSEEHSSIKATYQEAQSSGCDGFNSTLCHIELSEPPEDSLYGQKLIRGTEKPDIQESKHGQMGWSKGCDEETSVGVKNLKVSTVSSIRTAQSSGSIASRGHLHLRQLTSGTWQEVFKLFLANEHALGDPHQSSTCKQKKMVCPMVYGASIPICCSTCVAKGCLSVPESV